MRPNIIQTRMRRFADVNARRRLNISYLNGSLLFAGIIGVGAQSWAVFLVALAVLIATGVYCGDIRPHPRR
jgi:hypothetical protein